MKASERTQRQRKADADKAARAQLRYRQATVIDTAPVTVAPGGGGEVLATVLDGATFSIGDVVECLEGPGILLVLGTASTSI